MANGSVDLESFKELFSHTKFGIYRNTPGPQGHFIYANSSMLKMFDADSLEQFLEHNVSDFYQDPKYREVISEKILSQGFIESEELSLKTLKGRPVIGAVTAVIRKDPNGATYFDGIIEDVTEHRQHEAELAARNVELKKINDILIDRELTMINLKRENAKLRAQQK